ncbi:MAG TPA: prolipoprotein diacylglyceryl transferase family protein [Acidimicrobiia bacterium]
MEFTLLWAVLTAAVFAWAGLHIWDDRVPSGSGDRLLVATLLAVVAGRITAMLVAGVNPLTHPADLIVVRAGVDTAAASLVFVLSLAWTNRRLPGALDALAPAVLTGLAGWHAGCLWRGACLGSPSELPWAWSQYGSLVTRHPVEIYAALALIVAAWLVGRLGWRPYLRAGVGMALAAAIRWATEPLRPSLGGGPWGWYLGGIVLGVVIMAVGPLLHERAQAGPT